MHFHYYALRHLCRALLDLYRGEVITACLSQNKNELVIAFESGYLRIGCNTPLTYIIPVEEFAKARKNVVDLFQDMVGLTLKSSRVVAYERSLVLDLSDDHSLILKMHGISSNVILIREAEVIELFNNDQEEDWEYTEKPGEYHPEIIETLEPELKEPSVLSALRQIAPVYEKQFAAKAFHLMQSDMSFAKAYKAIHKEVEEENFYVIREKTKMKFLLFEPPHEKAAKIRGIVPALRFFMRAHFQFSQYRRNFRELDKTLSKPVKKFQNVYDSYCKGIKQIENERNPEELGHILMANLHQLESGVKSVSLEDFYNGGSIKIKLKPELSPQENAKQYYDKHKQRRSKLAYLKDQLEDIENKQLEAETELEEFQKLKKPEELTFDDQGFRMEELKELKKLLKENEKEQKAEANERYPYRTFKREGYEIFVGKNAKNNDELSFKFASKEDLWLHAKDVSGSHVVIRRKAGKDLPGTVLEYAAQLAAFYSKRKNDTLVPVIYTPRKYIRKRKGDPPGLVVVAREEVIMVEPIRE